MPLVGMPNLREKMTKPPAVVALVYDGLCTFEFGIVSEVFGLPRPELGGDLYRFSSVALEDGPIRAAGGLEVVATGKRSELAQADIVVDMDKEVKVPIAERSVEQEDKRMRIVLNVYKDAEPMTGEGEKLAGDDAILAHLSPRHRPRASIVPPASRQRSI